MCDPTPSCTMCVDRAEHGLQHRLHLILPMLSSIAALKLLVEDIPETVTTLYCSTWCQRDQKLKFFLTNPRCERSWNSTETHKATLCSKAWLLAFQCSVEGLAHLLAIDWQMSRYVRGLKGPISRRRGWGGHQCCRGTRRRVRRVGVWVQLTQLPTVFLVHADQTLQLLLNVVHLFVVIVSDQRRCYEEYNMTAADLTFSFDNPGSQALLGLVDIFSLGPLTTEDLVQPNWKFSWAQRKYNYICRVDHINLHQVWLHRQQRYGQLNPARLIQLILIHDRK